MSSSGQDSAQPARAGTLQDIPGQVLASSSSSNSILRVTLLAREWGSFKDDLSTLNRELAKQLAKVDNVEVTMFVPNCSEEDKRAAKDLGITIVKAEALPGFEPIDWLAFPPRDLSIDIVVGHGIELGRQAQIIKVSHKCSWVQVVHMNPEGEAMHRTFPGSLSKGEARHKIELELCKMADFVIAVGPKLAEEFTASLRPCSTEVFGLTPGIFSEFVNSKQASEDLTKFRVLVIGEIEMGDFELKGYDIAAQAFAELKDTSYHLIFVGAPKGKEEEVKQYFIKHGISQEQLTVRSFCDSREKMADLFREADLVIMPSRSEGFGLTALGALSAGLPLLVSGNSGFGKSLSKVQFGSFYIVDSDAAKDWAVAVKRVRQKDRGIRLAEAESLSINYAGCHNWQNQCEVLVEKWQSTKLGGLESSEKKVVPQLCAMSQERKRKIKTQKDIVTINIEAKRCRPDVINDIAVALLGELDIRTDQGFKSFIDQLGGARLYMKKVEMGSLRIVVQCCSVDILEKLWYDYRSGHLNQTAEKCLVTDNILKKLKVSEVKLETTIDEQEYRECREYFQMKMPEKFGWEPQQPFDLKVMKAHQLDSDIASELGNVLRNTTRIKTLYLSCVKVAQQLASTVFKGISENKSLTAFTLETFRAIPNAIAIDIGNSLSQNSKLTCVTLKLFNLLDDSWATVIEQGLSGETPVTSVKLDIHDRMTDAAASGLTRILSVTSLISLAVNIHGNITGPVVTAISEGLSGNTSLRSFSLVVNGELTSLDLVCLENGVVDNKSLTSLTIEVFGKPPLNWGSVRSNILSAKKELRSVELYPNISGEISATQVQNLLPLVVKKSVLMRQSLSLNLWGELGFNGAKGLCKVIADASLTNLSVNIHGNVVDHATASLVQKLKAKEQPPSLAVNIFGELSSTGSTTLKGMSTSSQTESTIVTQQDPLTANVEKISSRDSEGTSSSSTVIVIVGDIMSAGKPEDVLLAANPEIVVNLNSEGEECIQILRSHFAKCESVTAVVLKINNYSDAIGDIGYCLLQVLEECKSLTTLTLTITNYSDRSTNFGEGLLWGLGRCTSLNALTLTINNYSVMSVNWGERLLWGLRTCKSLRTVALTINNYSDEIRDWSCYLLFGLGGCKSLRALSLTINNHSVMSTDWGWGMLWGLGGCKSLTTLTLTITNHSDMSREWGGVMLWGLGRCKSLTTLTLTINNHSYMSREWAEGLLLGLEECESLTTLTLTINNHSDMCREWGEGLLWGLGDCKSLTTLTLTINNYSDLSSYWGRGLLQGLRGCKSLTVLALTMNNHSDTGSIWGCGLLWDLRECKSLTTLTLTINNYCDTSRDWGRGLLWGLGECQSLTSLTLTISNYSDTWQLLVGELCSDLKDCKSLTTLVLSFDSFSGYDWGKLQHCLAQCKSLASLNVAVNLHGMNAM